jgi:hypothetical protein
MKFAGSREALEGGEGVVRREGKFGERMAGLMDFDEVPTTGPQALPGHDPTQIGK